MSKTRTNKQKGRRGQQEIVAMLLETFPELEQDDIRSTPMGCTGEDIMLSPKAQKSLGGVQIEIKRRKTLSVANYITQADAHGQKAPIVFMREDRGEWLTCIKSDYFLKLLRKAQHE